MSRTASQQLAFRDKQSLSWKRALLFLGSALFAAAIEASPTADVKPNTAVTTQMFPQNSPGNNRSPQPAAIMHTLSQAILLVIQERCDGSLGLALDIENSPLSQVYASLR